MLPLTLPFKDFSNNEKIAYLPKQLSNTQGPEDSTARIGDFAYYAPWGNIIIYHGGYSASPDVIKLGELDGDVNLFRTRGEVRATHPSRLNGEPHRTIYRRSATEKPRG